MNLLRLLTGAWIGSTYRNRNDSKKAALPKAAYSSVDEDSRKLELWSPEYGFPATSQAREAPLGLWAAQSLLPVDCQYISNTVKEI